MTKCLRGHEKTPENSYTDRNGKTSCKLCRQYARDRYRDRCSVKHAFGPMVFVKKWKRVTPCGSGVSAPAPYRQQLARERLSLATKK